MERYLYDLMIYPENLLTVLTNQVHFTISGLHIFLILSAAVFSTVCTVFFHILIASFDLNCVLYPKDIFLLNITIPNERMEPSILPNSTYNQIGCYTFHFNP